MDLVTKVGVESFLNKWLRTRNLSFLSLGIGIFSSSVSNLAICCLSNNFLESIVIALYFPVTQRDPHLVSLLDYCNNGFICRRSSSCSLSYAAQESRSDSLNPRRHALFDYTRGELKTYIWCKSNILLCVIRLKTKFNPTSQKYGIPQKIEEISEMIIKSFRDWKCM